MKQVWLVFWKDVRHLRAELYVYVLLLIDHAIVAPMVWPGSNPSQILVAFVTLTKVLIAASWLVIIARVVHADNLVGEEQFWITKPYRWRSLLGAKVVFVVLCIGVPFALMQWAILLQAGLSPLQDVGGMAITLMRFALIVWLPLLVLASATENVAMMFTFVAGAAVVWIGSLLFILSGPTDMRMSPPYSLSVPMGVLMAGILIYQYARRRTMHSRLAIVGALAFFLLMIVGYDRGGFGAPVKALIRWHYPVSRSMRLVFGDTVPYEERKEDKDVPRGMIEVKLPVHVDGLPADARLRETNIAVEIDGAGFRYAPPWQSATVSEHAVGFLMPKDVFDRFSTEDARVHLELVAEEVRPERVLHETVTGTFVGPMRSVCSFIEAKVYCRYAYREVAPARIELRACGGDFEATLRHVPAGAVPDPVVSEELSFKGKICAGDTIQFVEYATVSAFRLTNAASLKLGAYRAH